MRIIFILLFACLLNQHITAQVESSRKQLPQKEVREGQPSKKQMQAEMLSAINELNTQIADLEKQIDEAKKNKESEDTIKDLQDQVDMLKKQVEMMGGLNKTVSGISEKTFQQAGEEEALVPKKDHARINKLPKKILTEAQLALFIKNVHAEVEKMIPATEKKEALEIYNETKQEYNSVAVIANAASGCWMLGHWEKALYIMGRACMDDITDADNLNNYASFLISTGAEQAAMPILEYLNNLFPDNSTILNNMGQAWFGLGDMENAKKNLEEATSLYNNHSTANSSLSTIYEAEGDNDKAISFLKASIKETYDPDKEARLVKLGVKLKYADMPPFNYPMVKDPLGFLALVRSLPEDYPSRIGDDEKVRNINRYVNGLRAFGDKLWSEMEDLKFKIMDHDNVLAQNKPEQKEFLDPFVCEAHMQARRSVELLVEERAGNFSPFISQMLLPGLRPGADINQDVIPDGEILIECLEIWENEVLKPIADLTYAMQARVGGTSATCAEIDAATNAFMAKEAGIKKAGTLKIKRKVEENSAAIDQWIKLVLYSTFDNPPKNDDDLTWDLVSHLDYTIRRKRYKDGVVHNFLSRADQIVKHQARLRSACYPNELVTNDDGVTDELAALVPQNLKCEFKKSVNTPVVLYSLECNVIKEKPKRNMKKKKDPVPRGQGQSGARRSQTRGPLGSSTRGGANSFFYDWNEPITTNYVKGPLMAEAKDLSQYSIEYDRWGNLIGLNIQLNKEGTALADPDSAESGIDSRWSWNGIASPQKGFLNKLVIK